MRTRIALLMLAVFLCGCHSDYRINRAQQAEYDGDAIRAYRLYASVLRRDPGDGDAAEGMERIAPLAAMKWRKVGRCFEDRKEYESAWRCYMYALSIMPDDIRARNAIRRMEMYPDEISWAKENYLRHGINFLPLDDSELEKCKRVL